MHTSCPLSACVQLMRFGHIFLSQPLLDITADSFDKVRFLQDTFIDGIVVIKVDEGKSTRKLGYLIDDNVYLQKQMLGKR